MVEGIDDVSEILAHAAAGVPGAVLKFGLLVDEVGRDDLVDDPDLLTAVLVISELVGLVKFLDAAGEQAEGNENEDSARLALFERSCDFEDTVTGGEHVVDHDHVLAFDAGAQEFVRDDRVDAVFKTGIVAALVEHTHVQAKNVGVIDSALHSALVRADDQHVVVVDLKVVLTAQKALDKLIGRPDRIKAVERDRVHDAGVMGIKGDDVVDAHADQLLQRDRAVQRLSR